MRSHTVTVDDLDIHILECGSGPPVLFLHGWPTHAQLWRHVLPIAGQTRRAIAMDLPGFGASSKPAASYSFRFFDRVITAVLDTLEIDRLGLVVHDLGGPIGLHWAASHQDRIRELALLNTLVFPQLSPAVYAFVAASYLPVVRSLLSSPAGIAWVMRLGVHDKACITSEVAGLYQAPFQTRDARRALLAAAHGLHPKGFDTIEASLSGYEVPVRLLYGENDRILPRVAHTMNRVREHIPHAELTSIPSCGHFLQEDRPHEVADQLGAFLSLE